MSYEESAKILPKDFFTRPMPHMTKKEPKEDMISMKWPKCVLNGKVKLVCYKGKEN